MMFWLSAAILLLLALVFVLAPLFLSGHDARWQSGPETWRWLLPAWLILMPVSTLLLYRELGAPAILDVQPALQGKSHDVDAMLAALETRLKSKPDDAEGWYVLGRSYLELQRLAEAEAALDRAVKLAPKMARYLSQFAEIVAMTDQGNLEKRARVLVEAALELDPQEEKALELAGLAAYQREDWAQAVFYWRHLLKRLPPGTEFYQDIETALKKARGMAEQALGLGGKAKLDPPQKRNPP